jgi:L-rhamnose isomerase
LTSETGEYQIVWEELAEGESIVVRFTFRQPMTVTRIDWSNLDDVTRYKQNYRARGIVIDAQNALQPFPKQLEDVPGTQSFGYAAVNANWIEFTVESAYAAEVVDSNVFRELAIHQITIIGRPANTTG